MVMVTLMVMMVAWVDRRQGLLQAGPVAVVSSSSSSSSLAIRDTAAAMSHLRLLDDCGFTVEVRLCYASLSG